VNTADSSQPQICTQNIGDTELSYLLYEGEGPPLILLHATGFQPWLWHPLARELAREYRVLAPSFCDHRLADPTEGGLSWVTLAEDTVRLCECLQIERPFLAGHSMGATVLMIAHTRFGLPATGMVLIEPILLPSELYRLQLTVEQHPWASKSLQRTNFWHDRADALAYLHSRSLFQEWDAEMLEIYIEHGMIGGNGGGLQLACSPQREASLFMGGVQFDPWPLLAKVSTPVLILEGEKSTTRSFLDVDHLRSLLPVSDYRLIANAGHLLPMERPQEVTKLIVEFFRKL
jgi:lipase